MKKKKSEISTNVIDFTDSSMVGAGFENVNASELAIPFLKIAQSYKAIVVVITKKTTIPIFVRSLQKQALKETEMRNTC